MIDIYRAKIKGTNTWVEGLPYRDLKTTREYAWFLQTCEKKDELETCKSYEIDENTLCKFTEHKDIKDNKIWQHDILMAHGSKLDLAKVVFGEFYVIDAESYDPVDTVIGWHYQPIETDALSKTVPFCLPMPLINSYIKLCEFEVVGNIFDTPDLLKSETQKRQERKKENEKSTVQRDIQDN